MAGPVQLQVVPQHRLHPPHLGGELGPGEDHVQSHQGAVILLDGLARPSAVRAQLGQDALNLLLLLALQLLELVVGVDHPHGLDEEGAARAGHVVHQAGDVVLVLALHRHHIPAPPHGDDGLPQVLGLVGTQQPVEHLPHLPRRHPDVPADVRQLRRGPVGDLLFAENGAGDLVLQEPVGGEGLEVAVQHRLGGGLARAVLLHGAGAAQHLGDVQQLPGVQAAPPVRPAQGGLHRAHAGKAGRTRLHQQLERRRRLLLQAGHLLPVGAGPGRLAKLLALLGHRLLGQQLQHPGQFQGADGFFKQLRHAPLPPGAAGPGPGRPGAAIDKSPACEIPAPSG